MPYPGDCNRYYETRTLSCPANSYWSEQLQRCETMELTKCPISARTSNPQENHHDDSLAALCAAQKGVFIPYPGDCTRFIQCDYLPFVKTCPQHLFWNSRLLTCDKICV
nr:uncharacterized protein LOC116650721 [Drosophila virilis]